MPFVPVIPPGSGKPLAPYSPGAVAPAGNEVSVLYVAGTLSFDKENNVLFPDDAAAQTRHILETIKSVVETAGGTMADIVFNQIFVTDWKHYAPMNAVYAEFFPGDKPARYCIQCGLVKPGAVVEIASIAHLGRT